MARVLIVGPAATLRRKLREALRHPARGGRGKGAGHSAGGGFRITEAAEAAEAVSLLRSAPQQGESFSVAVVGVAPAERRPALKLARLLAETAPELPLILCIPPEDGAWWENVVHRIHPWRVSVLTQPPDPLTLRGLIRALAGRGMPAVATPAPPPPRPKPAPAPSSPPPPGDANSLLRHAVEGLLQGLGQ